MKYLDLDLVRVLWPHLTGARIDAVSVVGHVVRIDARTDATPAECPDCEMVSDRAHTRYDRHLSDTAAAAGKC